MLESFHIRFSAGDCFVFDDGIELPMVCRFSAQGELDSGPGGSNDDDVAVVPDGGSPDEAAGLAARQRLISEARRYRKRAQDAERELSQVKGRALTDDEAEMFERLKAESASHRQVMDSHDAAIDKFRIESDAKVANALKQNERLRKMLGRTVGADRLKTVLAARGVQRVDQAAMLLEGHLDVDVGDDGCHVNVIGYEAADGVNPSGGLEGMVDTWLLDNPHFLPPSGDVGSGIHAGVGRVAGVSLEQLDKHPRRKAEFVARHGPQALVQLAQSKSKSKHGG